MGEHQVPFGQMVEHQQFERKPKTTVRMKEINRKLVDLKSNTIQDNETHSIKTNGQHNSQTTLKTIQGMKHEA